MKYSIGVIKKEILRNGDKEPLSFIRSQFSENPYEEETTSDELRLMPDAIKKGLEEKGEVTFVQVIETTYYLHKED